MDKLRFLSLASGSSGNCYYVGNATTGFLIDAGIGPRTIRRRLKAVGLDFENLWGIFITHDHTDHIRGVGVLGEKFHIPVYSTFEIHEGINRNYVVTEKLYGSRKIITKGETVKISDFSITSFPVMHDASDCVGYTIEYQDKRLTIATDIGTITDEAASHIVKANYLILEANHDVQMLLNGSYPQYLKQRILADTGHLSNDQAGAFLAENFPVNCQNIFLCHLSRENNMPQKAYETIKNYLKSNKTASDKEIKITVLDRTTPSKLFIFGN